MQLAYISFTAHKLEEQKEINAQTVAKLMVKGVSTSDSEVSH